MTTRKWGNELLVNTTTAGNQDQSSVTGLADGGFVVTWRDNGPADSVIRWQRYDATGVKLGAEQTITTFSIGDQTLPQVVQLSDGNLWFVDQDDDIRGDFDIDGQVFTLTGTFVRDQAPNALGLSDIAPSIASLGASGSVAVWRSTDNFGDIQMRGFNTDGSERFAETTVNTNDFGTLGAQQTQASVAASRDGSKFVVVWRDDGINAGDIHARVFNSNGVQTTAEFTVGSFTGSTEQDAQVTWLDNGRFVVSWTQPNPLALNGGDGSDTSIKYAIYNANGTMFGAERLANSTTFGNQVGSTITSLPSGGFVIAWFDDSRIGGDTSGSTVRLQVFDGAGDKIGGEILVNTTTIGNQTTPSIAALADGRIVVSWTDFGGSDGDTASLAIRSQIVDPRDGIIDGTAGIDKLYGHDSVGDIISAGDGADFVFGLAGADTIYGGAGIDTLDGGRGDDTLYGGADGDILIGGLGADEIFGEAGSDIVSFALSRSGVTVNLLTGEGFGGEAEGDSYSSIEGVRGSNFVDVITAGNVVTSLFGLNGADQLIGGTAGDTFVGGAGADIMNGGGGIDTAYYASTALININLLTNVNTGGDAQGDSLSFIENISGTVFGDTILGNGLNNALFGQAGNDRLGGGTGVDTLTGSTGSDTFVFAAGDTGQTAATADIVADYAKGFVGTGDEFDFTSALIIGGVAGVAGVNQASINATTGVATFAALSGTTMADALADIATSINVGGSTAGEFAFFRVNNTGNFHLFISDGEAGVGANDVLVQLTGITTIFTHNLTDGDLTIF